MRDEVMALAARGWPVFPCHPESKKPLTPKESQAGAKDGGLYLASCDTAQIEKWWRQWPNALVGVPTGSRIGAFVIDLDPRKVSADDMLADLRRWLGEALPPCPVSRTQSGGLHLFFKMPAEKLGNRAALFRKVADAPENIREHVDVRGDGGYVIVPPSVMANGNRYAWEQEPDGEDFPPAPQKLIDVVLKKLDEKRGSISEQALSNSPRHSTQPTGDRNEAIDKARHRYAMAALDNEIGALAAMPQGGRNDALNKAAFALGGLIGAGILSETIARAELMRACERNGLIADDGFEPVNKTLQSGIASGIAKPIDISQIGTRAGTSQKRRSGAAARPSDSASPSKSSYAPAPSDDAQEDPDSQPGMDRLENSSGGAGDEARRAAFDKRERRADLDIWCSTFPLTDLGNAQRFTARFGDSFLYVDQWGWLAWDGKRWNGHEADAILNRAIHTMIKAIAEEAHQVRLYQMIFTPAELFKRVKSFKDGDAPTLYIDPVVDIKSSGKITLASDRLAGWCLASQSNAHISCVAKLAQAYLTASPDSFDVDPCAMNVDNGTLHFKVHPSDYYVKFTPHNRADRMTKITPVVYDADAKSPIYDKFLARVQPDEKMRRHLHAWGGVSLTGLPLARLAFWHGKGRNGKSTLIDCWAHVMGEYSQTIPIESFLDQGRSRRGGEASPDIAALPGIRCLRTSEPEKGAQLAESMVKLVTGGEPLRARHLNRDFFEFRPAFKLTMQGNYRPKIVGTDEGLWARMLLVPWNVFLPEEERDVTLPDKLRGEASGILNHLLAGLCDYLDHGLVPTAEVLAATADYREDSDPVGQFLKDCTKAEEPEKDLAGHDHFKARVGGKEIFDTYVAWARANGERPWSHKAFSRGLQDHGIRRLKSSGIFYLGLTMIKTAFEFEGMAIEETYEKKKT